MEPFARSLTDIICGWFEYDPIHGLLIRRLKTRSDAHDVIPPDRSTVFFQGKDYDYATLCWVVYYKTWPKEGCIIDHRNGIKADHSLENLREATLSQNQQNKAGYGIYAKGVSCRFDGSRKKPYQARIRLPSGKRLLLGSFATEEEAAKAYQDAAVLYHGEFACLH